MTTVPRTAKIKPAVAWPDYEEDHARKELAALEMITSGVPLDRIALRTDLPTHHVRRLARLAAEEAKFPKHPRNVCRHPRRSPRYRRSSQPAPAAPRPAEEPEQLSII
ncbi:hypothetical protein [Streptomyces sp. NPDC001889]